MKVADCEFREAFWLCLTETEGEERVKERNGVGKEGVEGERRMLIVGCSAKAVRLYGSDRKWNQMTADTNCDSQTIRLNYLNSAPSTMTLYCSVTV